MSNPHVEDAPRWEAALEHYEWDRVEEAFRCIRGHGVGEAGVYLRWFRLIESEALTRRYSRIESLTPWLSFEYVPDELGALKTDVVRRTLRACDEVANRLGWQHGVETRLAILSEAVDAPWASHPYGYCSEKEPYYKICLPAYLVEDGTEYRQAVAHEYAHVVSAHLANGYAPRWLEEAVSVLAERSFSHETWEEFRADPDLWLSPSELEIRLDSRADEEQEKDAVWRAYQQCGWIGQYLVSLGDEKRLGDLLRAHADEGVWRNLKLALWGQERVDAALKTEYGLDSRRLFRSAFQYLSQHEPY